MLELQINYSLVDTPTKQLLLLLLLLCPVLFGSKEYPPRKFKLKLVYPQKAKIGQEKKKNRRTRNFSWWWKKSSKFFLS